MKTKTITIRVTAADIRTGSPNDPGDCPVILAAKRHRLGLRNAGYVNLVFRNKPNAPTPTDMLMWMRDFDNGRKVKPATFTIEIPAQTGAN